MTYDLASLRAIEKRLAEASAPQLSDTDELGVAVYETLGICSYIPDEGDPTLSLDAAVALCERVLPGHAWGADYNGEFNKGRRCHAFVRGPGFGVLTEAIGQTPALALCLAIVRALISEQGK